MIIPKRKRKVHFADGIPYVSVNGILAPVKTLLADGDSNTKLRKNSLKVEYLTAGLSLSPAGEAGAGNMCAHKTIGCETACLDHQGMAHVWRSIREARIRKTVVFRHARKWFLDKLESELEYWQERAIGQGKKLAARLNMYTDVMYEKLGIIGNFPDIIFYDYSKNPRRFGFVRPNYHVTLSRSEFNENDCIHALRNGGNVAVPYDDGFTTGARNLHGAGPYRMPKRWRGWRTISGDEHDLRFLDETPRAVMLVLKTATVAERLSALDSGFARKGVNVS